MTDKYKKKHAFKIFSCVLFDGIISERDRDVYGRTMKRAVDIKSRLETKTGIRIVMYSSDYSRRAYLGQASFEKENEAGKCSRRRQDCLNYFNFGDLIQ